MAIERTCANVEPKGLLDWQKRGLVALDRYIRKNGEVPSLSEWGDSDGKSKSTAQQWRDVLLSVNLIEPTPKPKHKTAVRYIPTDFGRECARRWRSSPRLAQKTKAA